MKSLLSVSESGPRLGVWLSESTCLSFRGPGFHPTTYHPYQKHLKQCLRNKAWVSYIIVLGLRNNHCSFCTDFQNWSWLDWLVLTSVVCLLLDLSFDKPFTFMSCSGCQALFWGMHLAAGTDMSKYPGTGHTCYPCDLTWGCKALPLTGSVTNLGTGKWPNYWA